MLLFYSVTAMAAASLANQYEHHHTQEGKRSQEFERGKAINFNQMKLVCYCVLPY